MPTAIGQMGMYLHQLTIVECYVQVCARSPMLVDQPGEMHGLIGHGDTGLG